MVENCAQCSFCSFQVLLTIVNLCVLLWWQVYGPVPSNSYGSLSFPGIWSAINIATANNSTGTTNAKEWAAVQHEIYRVARVTTRASLVLQGRLTWLDVLMACLQIVEMSHLDQQGFVVFVPYSCKDSALKIMTVQRLFSVWKDRHAALLPAKGILTVTVILGRHH